jgi:macrodomain Ter protein organizer (MatP/YcbG family)
MSQIRLEQSVKERLAEYKRKHGCKTYSEAVNLLLHINEVKESIENVFVPFLDKITKYLDNETSP